MDPPHMIFLLLTTLLGESIRASNLFEDLHEAETFPQSPQIRYGDGILYPYGPEVGCSTYHSDDLGTMASADKSFKVFGNTYTEVIVNANGLLTFEDMNIEFTPRDLPVTDGAPFLAPFWADVDPREPGALYYRWSNDSQLLGRIQEDINDYFPNAKFSAQRLFVATWHRVSYFGSLSDEVNTFQTVLAVGGNNTFVLFNYGDLQWPAAGSSYKGPMPLAGLNSGHNQSYVRFPESLSSDIIKTLKKSNVNVAGRWAFKVDSLDLEDTNGIISEPNNDPTNRRNGNPVFSNALFYPYGLPVDAVSSKFSFDRSPPIQPSKNIPLFGNVYSSLYVHNNGFLTTNGKILYDPMDLPIYGDLFLAPFWTSVDSSKGGYVYYRQTTDSDILSRATRDVRTYFHDLSFTAEWVLIATWDGLTYNAAHKISHSFQAVLISGGKFTFVLFNYEDMKSPPAGYMQALAGLNSGEVTGYYKIPGSLSLDIFNVASTTNVNVPGRWAFRVDRHHPEDGNGIVELLYPFGPELDSITDRLDVGGSPLITLTQQVPLFGENVSSLFVNNNGLLSFGAPINQFLPQDPLTTFGHPFLAPFWADVDTIENGGGGIYYRQGSDLQLISWVSSNIRTYFNDPHYHAKWLFVSTWYRVQPYNAIDYMENTFQALLSTDGHSTYVIFNYKNIEWVAAMDITLINFSYETLLRGSPAMAGLNTGSNTGYYKLPGSLTPDIINITRTSNVQVPGRWAFRIDTANPQDPSGNLDMSNGKAPNPSKETNKDTDFAKNFPMSGFYTVFLLIVFTSPFVVYLYIRDYRRKIDKRNWRFPSCRNFRGKIKIPEEFGSTAKFLPVYGKGDISHL
ncbi:dendrite extension defective protein 1-like [Hyperolius riggenbachi]|uniref:dendrite extension defective protein 1-like n=1 Tax=Hyperolius riggenbachi TaxID=752182 RepID=UPI0035A28F96